MHGTPALGSEPDFGELLGRAVRRKGWTMAAFAREVGCSPATVSRIRTGRRAPDLAACETWCAALGLEGDEQARFLDAALIAQAPPALRHRLREVEGRADAERARRDVVERDFGEFRRRHSFYDGWWVAYSYAFLNDGTVLRSSAHVDGERVSWKSAQDGRVRYSYHGRVEVLGDKVFFTMSEDRGDVEHVQVVMNSLFDFPEPAFLYGMVCGISGKNLRHPRSDPAAARMAMCHVATDEEVERDPSILDRLDADLGTFRPERLRPLYPPYATKGDAVRRCLELREREDLDAVLLRMIANRLDEDDCILRAPLA